MIRYRINGEYLDQSSTIKDFAVTKQISKIGELNSRHGDYTTAFKIPLTANNARILRYTPELNNNSDIGQFRRYNGQLVEDEAVISDGYYQVIKFSPTKHEVEIKFFGGNSDWFDLLKDRYINIEVREGEYPYLLTEFQHEFTSANVTGSWDFSKPYYYFIRDNGRNSYVTKSSLLDYQEDFAVSFLEKSLFNRIFDSVDIKLQGDLFNDVSFDRTIVASVADTRETFLSDDRITDRRIVPNVNEIVNESIQTWTSVRFDGGDYNDQWDGTTFTAKNSIGDLRFDFFISIDAPQNVTDIKIRVLKNGVPTDYTMNEDLNSSRRLYSLRIIETSVGIGDSFEFQFAYVGPITGSYCFIKGQQFSGLEISEQFISPLVDASKILPKIKQTDFVKDIMVRYGVISFYDPKSRTLTLNRFENIDNNRLNAPDWTNKIDLSKEIEVDFTKILSDYAKRSIFEYQDDTENDSMASVHKGFFGYNEGTGIISIDNDFLSDEKSVYKSPYAPTISRLSLPYSNPRWFVPFLPTQKPSGEDSGSLTFEAQELKPRIMYASTLSVSDINNNGYTQVEIDSSFYNTIGYAYFSKTLVTGMGSEGVNELSASIMYGNLSGQTFVGDSLLEKNYSFYNKILNDPFYVSLYMNLSALDVQQLDFFTPIFLEYRYDSGYYYIDSVEQYKGDGSTTKINLVKI